MYDGDEIFFRASKTKTLDEMEVVIDQDGLFMATTMDWDIEEETYNAF